MHLSELVQLVQDDLGNVDLIIREQIKNAILSQPEQIELSNDSDGLTKSNFWKITEEIGSYFIVFAELKMMFGVAVLLDTGVKWYMGSYGSFSEAVNSI